MARRNPSRARGRPREDRRQDAGDRIPAAAIRSPTSSPQPPLSARPVHIHNGHPQLRFDRRAVIAALRCLDAHAAEILGQRATRRLSTLDFLSSKALATEDRPSATPGVSPGELSLAFLTNPALARLHARFLGDRSPTDVITFSGPPAPGGTAAGAALAGEICVSADAARAFAARRRRDFSAELTLYLVHGWLHLAGHDDRQPAPRRHMRAAEARAMALLRAARAVPRFQLAAAAVAQSTSIALPPSRLS